VAARGRASGPPARGLASAARRTATSSWTTSPSPGTTPSSSRNGEFSVEDQGSLNGTFVNRKRIDRSPLRQGDELQVGKYRLTFIA
jgi:hypothetical protein